MPNFWKRRAPLSAYNIADVGTSEAEINLYGEIVEKPPVDWFGDEQHEGFIILSDFMESLENLVGKEYSPVQDGKWVYAGTEDAIEDFTD
jgi:hypothetical protein